MLCDICQKDEATVHFTEMINDQITELHLCEECAREKGAQTEQQFSLSDLLAGLVDFSIPEGTTIEDIKMKCPNCKLTYEDFKKIGRLGCSECYNTFRVALEPLLKNIHGSTHHIGKSPQKSTKVYKAKSQFEELKTKLQKAIQVEAYEEAAKLRDMIRELEKQQGQG
ncbi:MAG: UvrB/UvrC motif-containing protein [Candidatus Omnitrophota bacterium]